MINKKNVWWFFAFGMACILLGIGLVQGVTYQYMATPITATTWNNGQGCYNESITSTTNYTINYSIIAKDRGRFHNATISLTPFDIPVTDGTYYPSMAFPNASSLYTVYHYDSCGSYTSPQYVDDNNAATRAYVTYSGGSCSDWGYWSWLKLNYTYNPKTRVNATYQISVWSATSGIGLYFFYCENKTNPGTYIRNNACDANIINDGANHTYSCELSPYCLDSTMNISFKFDTSPRGDNPSYANIWELGFIGNITMATPGIINVSTLLNNTYLADSRILTANTSVQLRSAYLNNSYYNANWSLLTFKTNASTLTLQICAANFTYEDAGIVIGNTTFTGITQHQGTNWTTSPSFNYNYTCTPSRAVVGIYQVNGDLVGFPSLTCDGASHIQTQTAPYASTGNYSGVLTIVPAGTSSWIYFTDYFYYDHTPPTIKLNVTWNPTGPNGTISLQCNDTEASLLLFNWTWNTITVEKANYTSATIKTNASGINLGNLRNDLNASCTDLALNSIYSQHPIMNNSLTTRYLDENTGSAITENVTLEVIQNETLYNYYSTTGSRTIWRHNESTPVWLGIYDIDAFSSSYAKRNGVITFIGNENVSYTFYLANQSSTVTFTVQDKLTKEAVSEAIVSMARIIGTAWVEIASKQTDITGKTVFSYTPNVRYRFNITKTGYDDKVFYLDPIIFSSYTVEIESTGEGYYALDQDDVTLYFDPHVFYNDQTTFLNVSILSAGSNLNSYSFRVCYPGGCNESSGVGSAGEVLRTSFNITGAGVWDKVKINVTYDTDFSGSRTLSYQYTIIGATFGRYTWINNRTEFYGTGWLERIAFATFLLIIIVGVITLTAGPLAGGAVLIIMLGFFTYLRFIPVWAILASVLVGIILLGKRASE